MTTPPIEQRRFVRDPFLFLKILGPLLAVLAVVTVVVLSYAPPTRYSSRTDTILTLPLIIVVVFAFVLLIASFWRKLVVDCGPDGCNIDESNFGGGKRRWDSFRWNDVTDTGIIEITVEKGRVTICIVVEVADVQKRVLPQIGTSGRDFDELLDLINRATPHLQYEWERSSEVRNRYAYLEIEGYSKVART